MMTVVFRKNLLAIRPAQGYIASHILMNMNMNMNMSMGMGMRKDQHGAYSETPV